MTNSSPLPRRRFLQAILSAGGAGLSLTDILRQQALAESMGKSPVDTAVIQIWLGGGPSQFETFDPKPAAPAEIRGPYSAIQTKLPGILFCETMPRTATVLDRAAIIRTVRHDTNDHFSGAHWCSTGYPSNTSRSTHPSSGAIASRFRGAANLGLPAYLLLSEEQTRNPEIATVMGAAHLGSQHAPFTIMQDPFEWSFQQDKVLRASSSLKLADDLTLSRVANRRSLLTGLDRFTRQADATREMDGIDIFTHSAFNMLTSGAARRAFDLHEESEATRDRYGRHRWGQMALLARRLVEAGVTFVTLNTAPDSLCWDWHRHIVNDNRPADGSDGPTRGMDISGPPLDRMLSTLIADLYERGLDRKVLLVVWGEFGRTPRVNATGGRDHWGSLMSTLIAGGGLKVGQVIGTSNANGEVPSSRPVSPTDVLATIYRHLGIDLTQHTVTNAGRPIPILPDGAPIAELL
ncbi:MAG: DUF1501 domain-containing protein [Planctomycetota bacterium]|nr:DUF1501 domain-containing protein [Planctomycetota bacterium]